MQSDFICQEQCDDQGYADWAEMEQYYQSVLEMEQQERECQDQAPENFEDFPF